MAKEMSLNRFGERGDPRYRSKRLYRTNGRWYFDTREGMQFGPFSTPKEARKVLAFFVAQNAQESPATELDVTDPLGAQDGIGHMVQEALDVLRCQRNYGSRAALTWAESRLEDLGLKSEKDSNTLECMDMLRYAMSLAEHSFDFVVFLENHALVPPR